MALVTVPSMATGGSPELCVVVLAFPLTTLTQDHPTNDRPGSHSQPAGARTELSTTVQLPLWGRPEQENVWVLLFYILGVVDGESELVPLQEMRGHTVHCSEQQEGPLRESRGRSTPRFLSWAPDEAGDISGVGDAGGEANLGSEMLCPGLDILSSRPGPWSPGETELEEADRGGWNHSARAGQTSKDAHTTTFSAPPPRTPPPFLQPYHTPSNRGRPLRRHLQSGSAPRLLWPTGHRGRRFDQ